MSRLALVVILLAACGHRGDPVPPLVPAKLVSGATTIPYPPALYHQRIQGEVLLYLVVDSMGEVVRDSTRIAKSSGQASFDSAALAAAPRLHFTPARRGATAVTAPIQIPIHFLLPDSLSADSTR